MRRAKLATRPMRLYWRPFIVRVLHGRMADVADVVDWPEGEAYSRAAAELSAAVWGRLEVQARELMLAFATMAPAVQEAADSMERVGRALADHVCRCGTDAEMYQEDPRRDNPRWVCGVCGGHVCYDRELDPDWPNNTEADG